MADDKKKDMLPEEIREHDDFKSLNLEEYIDIWVESSNKRVKLKVDEELFLMAVNKLWNNKRNNKTNKNVPITRKEYVEKYLTKELFENAVVSISNLRSAKARSLTYREITPTKIRESRLSLNDFSTFTESERQFICERLAEYVKAIPAETPNDAYTLRQAVLLECEIEKLNRLLPYDTNDKRGCLKRLETLLSMYNKLCESLHALRKQRKPGKPQITTANLGELFGLDEDVGMGELEKEEQEERELLAPDI